MESRRSLRNKKPKQRGLELRLQNLTHSIVRCQRAPDLRRNRDIHKVSVHKIAFLDGGRGGEKRGGCEDIERVSTVFPLFIPPHRVGVGNKHFADVLMSPLPYVYMNICIWMCVCVDVFPCARACVRAYMLVLLLLHLLSEPMGAQAQQMSRGSLKR